MEMGFILCAAGTEMLFKFQSCRYLDGKTVKLTVTE